MPKLMKIRIAGLKYDGFQKKVEDELFDFQSDIVKADHGLITLMNGGGKGVLLHTLFQVMLPGTNWGPLDEKKYFNHFFYDVQSRFRPYPFYVLLQFAKDSGKEDDYLTIGMAATAEKRRVSAEEEGGKIEIYRKTCFFLHEHEGENVLDAQQFPLHEEGKLRSFEGFETYLDDQALFLRKFRDEARFHRELKTYGIDKKEWKTMRTINRAEGGVQAYFDAGTTNHMLFKKQIIPTISETMAEGTSVADFFASQFSIVQDLPQLQRRKATWSAFLEDVVPLKAKLAQEREMEEKQSEIVQYGRTIRKNLQEVRTQEEYRKAEAEQEVKEKEKELEQYRHQMLNIDYAKKYREKEEQKQLAEAKEKEVQAHQEHVRTNDMLIREAKRDARLADWYEMQKKVDVTREELQAAKERLGMRGVEEKIQAVTQEARDTWGEVETALASNRVQAESVLNHLEEIYRGGEEESDGVQLEITRLHGEIESLHKEEDTYQGRLASKKLEFGMEVGVRGNKLTKEHRTSLEKEKGRSEKLYQSIQHAAQEISEMEKKNGVLDKQVEVQEEKRQVKKAAYEERYQQEREMAERIGNVLLEDPVEVLDAVTLANKSNQISEQLEVEKAAVRNYQRLLWAKEGQSQNAHQDYLVPNPDIPAMVQALENIGVQALAGTSYIHELPKADKEKAEALYPALRYGVLINKQDRDKVMENRVIQETISSMVPVFVRGEFEEATLPFIDMRDETVELAFHSDAYVRWMDRLEQEKEQYRHQMNGSIKTEDHIRALLADINNLYHSEFASSLKYQEEMAVDELHQVRQEQASLHSLLTNKKEEQVTKEAEREESRAKQQQLERKVEVLQEWEEEVNNHHQRQKSLRRFQVQKEKEEKRLQQTKKQVEKVREQYSKEENAYRLWMKEAEAAVQRFQEIIEGVVFPEASGLDETSRMSAENSMVPVHQLEDIYSRWSDYQNQYESEDVEIARLSERLDSQMNHVREEEKALDSLETAWREYDIPEETGDQLRRTVDDYEDQREKRRELLRQTDKEQSRLEGISHKLQADCDEKAASMQKQGIAVSVPEDEDLDLLRTNVAGYIQDAETEKQEYKEYAGALEESRRTLAVQEGIVDSHLEESSEEGEVDRALTGRLQKGEAEQVVKGWTNDKGRFEKDLREKKRERQAAYRNFRKNAGSWDAGLAEKIFRKLDDVIGGDGTAKEVERIVLSISHTAESEKVRAEADAKEAEEGRQRWLDRAEKKVKTMLEYMKDMTRLMTVENEAGYRFPLIRIDGMDELLQEKENMFQINLAQYFNHVVEKVKEEFAHPNVDDAEVRDFIRKWVSDANLVERAMGGQFPKMKIYKMETQNAFQQEKPRQEHYVGWEIINKGNDKKTSGSGGQKLSARALVIMLLMSFKKRRETDGASWTTLILDNPFGQASSAHVLDPIFSIANKLQFQLICFCPPEMSKIEISKRFGNYYNLQLKQGRGGEKLTTGEQGDVEVMDKFHRAY